MNQEIKAKWIAALRSGEYKQTTADLRNKRGFCCLGVLCDITKDQVGGHWDEEGRFMHLGNYYSSRPPEEVLEAVGIHGGNVYFSTGIESRLGTGQNSLVALNDGGFTFDQIADVIDYAF